MTARTACLLALILVLAPACASPGAHAPAPPATTEPQTPPTFYELFVASRAEATCSLQGLVAHAGGVVDVPGIPGGLLASNSLEALELSVARGHRHIEVDLIETSDGQLVALHDWGQAVERLFGAAPGVRSHAEWEQLQSRHGLRHLDVDGLLEWLGDQADGLCLVLDVKGDVPAAAQRIAARANGVLDRIHPQVHTLADVEPLKALGFAPPWLALYAADLDDAELLAALDAGPRPQAVTIPLGRAGLIDALRLRWIPALAHTADHGQQVLGLQERGFHGVFTDRLAPADWRADPFLEDATRFTVVPHSGVDLATGWVVPDVLPWRGVSGAHVYIPEEERTFELVDGQGQRTNVDASRESLESHPDTVALRAVVGAETALTWPGFHSRCHLGSYAGRHALHRKPLTRAHRLVTFSGRGEGLAGLALTFFNPTDNPVRGTLIHWRSDEQIEQSVEVTPWSTRVVLAPAHAGAVEATYSGEPVLIQPLWHDALFLHVR